MIVPLNMYFLDIVVVYFISIDRMIKMYGSNGKIGKIE